MLSGFLRKRLESFLLFSPVPHRFVSSGGGGGASERHERLRFCSQHPGELFHLGLSHPASKGNDPDPNTVLLGLPWNKKRLLNNKEMSFHGLSVWHCQETLRRWRERENTRILNNSKLQPFGVKATADGIFADDQLLLSGREMLVDELNKDFIVLPSLNGKLASAEAQDQPVDAFAHKTLVSLFHPQAGDRDDESVDNSKAGLQHQVKGYEWIEMGVRRQVVGAPAEEAEKKTEYATTRGSRGVFRNNRMHHVDSFCSSASLALGPDPAGTHVLLVGGYPAVDYPMDEDSNSQSATREPPSVPGEGLTAMEDSEQQLRNQDTWRGPKQPGDVETDTRNISHNLKSSGLQKRRPNENLHSPSNQTPRQHLGASFSKSHPDYSQNMKRNSIPSELGWDLGRKTRERIPPDPQTLSEPEPSALNLNENPLQVKTQRSASTPNIPIRHELRPSSSGLDTSPQCRQTSPLEGLLRRAKERVKERSAFPDDQNLKVADWRTGHPPPSPSFSTPRSASLSDGDKEPEEEVEVELTRYRALTVSDGWKEQLVDGDEEYKRDRWV